VLVHGIDGWCRALPRIVGRDARRL
jgi:hypothetical protein